MLALSKLLPDQKTQGQHHRHRLSVKARPQPTLILIPAQFPFGFFMELLNGMTTMRIIDLFLQRRRSRQVAPIELVLLGLSLSRPLTQQPADVGLTLGCQTPGPQPYKFLAQPTFGPMPPPNGAPLAPRHSSQGLISPLTGRLLVVNRRGQRKLVVSPEQLASLVDAGRVVLRTTEAPCDLAMKRLWQQLNQAQAAPMAAIA